MSAQPEAHDALLRAIAKAAPKAKDSEELGHLAEAYSKVVHGPQGGSMDYDYANATTTHTHQHHHDERGPAGFTS